MFENLTAQIPADPDFPDRTRKLDLLTRVLEGRIYDTLRYSFSDERGAGGEYIPLRDRRPSVRYNLCRIVVEDSVALLFSEGHFPQLDCTDERTGAIVGSLFRQLNVNQIMTEAAIRGSVGSVALIFRLVEARPFFEVRPSMYLSAKWSVTRPDAFDEVTERYKVFGADLKARGYDIEDPSDYYWFQRTWTIEEEIWYKPLSVSDAQDSVTPVVDPLHTTRHSLGFVPVIWIKNLPGGSSTGDPSDGACTFAAAVDTQIEIDYQLSQAGRGLKYSSDPTLLIKEPAFADRSLIKGGANALVLSEKGDARLLEIGGTASAAVVEYVRTLRELALESIHGNRASPDRLTAAQSGRSLEMMNQGLIWLADNLRVSYGEGGLLRMADMVLRASDQFNICMGGQPVGPLDPTARFSLIWPRWYPPSADDRQKDAQTLVSLCSEDFVNKYTVSKHLSTLYDLDNHR